MEPTDLSLPTPSGRVTPTSIRLKCMFLIFSLEGSGSVHFSFTSSLPDATSPLCILPLLFRLPLEAYLRWTKLVEDHTRPDAHTCGASQASVAVFVHRCSGGIGRQRRVGRECWGFQCGLHAALDWIIYVLSCVVLS